MEHWKRTLAVSWIVMFIHMSGMSMISPFLPLYIRDLGITDPKALSVWSGLVFGVSFIMAAVCLPFWGALSDRFGRKPIILRTTFGLTVVCLLTAFVTNIYQLLALRILHGILGGMVSSFLALVSSSLPREKTGRGLGILQTSMVSSGILGPLLGGLLADWLGFRSVFLCVAGLAFTAGLVTVIFIREPAPSVRPEHRPRPSVVSNIRFVINSKHLAVLTGLQFVVQFSVMLLQPVLPLFIAHLYTGPRLATVAGLAFGVTGIASMLFTPFWGTVGDRRGHKTVLQRSLFWASLLNLPSAIVPSVWILIPLRAVLGIFSAGLAPSTQSLIVRNTPASIRGGVLGITQSLTLMGNALGPIIGGSLAPVIGMRNVFVVSSTFILLSWFLSRNLPRETETGPVVTGEPE